jgi:hypothetical protein
MNRPSRRATEGLNFGALAAERERDHLGSFFVVSPAFKRLRDGRKIIVLGNRGAGKTAMLSMLAAEANDTAGVVVSLAPEDFAYELLSETITREEAGSWNKYGAYAAAWKYLLYVLAMKALIKSMPGLKTGASKRIYSYVRDHHANTDLNPLGALISYLKRLEGIKIGKLEASIKARELQRLYRLEEIESLLNDLDEVSQKRPVLLLVDELDRGWDASQDAVSFVAGLFQAGTSIGIRTPNIRVVMALRRELYENIPSLYEDAQKVRDTIEVIDWDEPKLFDLICRRIAYSLGSPTATSNEELWHRIMPPTVHGRPSFDYLLGFTLHRPREVIQFCTQVQDVAAEGDESPPFSEKAIVKAESLYSRERFKDITAEYRFQYPALDSVLETFRGRASHIPRAELELHCLALSLGDVRVSKEASWVIDKDPDQLIETLWKVGFLRCAIPEGHSDSQQADGKYFGAHQLRTINTRNVEWFQVHDMFATYLGCV